MKQDEQTDENAEVKRMAEKKTAPVMTAAACSNIGCRRTNNEDNFCLNGQYMQREEMDKGGLYACRAEGKAIFAVCDGMGGEDAGEEASLLSVQLCARFLKDGAMSTERKALQAFFMDGCVSVMKQAQRNNNRSGSTVSLIIADDDGLYAANMGDSRIYRLSKQGFAQISEDHTEVQRLLKKGLIRKEEIKTHPKRHMIRQYWGMPLSVAPFSPYFAPRIPYQRGDKYLICSDGLTDMLEDVQIEAMLKQEKPVGEICQELVDEALRHGGKDNVTVLVFEIEDEGSAAQEGAKIGWLRRLFGRK